jgi:hypothetical protein
MILLMIIAYSLAVFQGTEINKMQVQKYVSRPKKTSKKSDGVTTPLKPAPVADLPNLS